MRMGVFYALYFLHYSQPSTWARAPIRVEPGNAAFRKGGQLLIMCLDTWRQLLSTCADFIKSGDASVVKAAAFLLRLKKDHGFVYTIQAQMETTNHLERMEMEPVYT